jgi:hypothetical protein
MTAPGEGMPTLFYLEHLTQVLVGAKPSQALPGESQIGSEFGQKKANKQKRKKQGVKSCPEKHRSPFSPEVERS